MNAETQIAIISQRQATDARPAAEPWLRGSLAGVHPLVMPVFFSFQQVREDLRFHLGDLTVEQVWKQIGAIASVGFHLKHMAGSVDRLSTYLGGKQLSPTQLDFLKQEAIGGNDVDTLLHGIDDALNRAEQVLQSIDAERLYDTRTVGREHLPTTVIGLIVHLAEHTQRHLGQAITTAKFVQATGIG